MKIIETGFEGLYELEPNVFGDKRGYFFESYRREVYRELGIQEDFVQDNESFSVKGTLRGLHYQENPYAQAKLVRVVQGKVLDVALDIRKDSPTFGKHHTVLLEAERHNMFLSLPALHMALWLWKIRYSSTNAPIITIKNLKEAFCGTIRLLESIGE